MKVCFVTANHPPEAVGGTEQVVTALARELQGLGTGITVLSGSDVPRGSAAAGPDDVRQERWQGVPVHRLFKQPDEYDRHGFVRPRLLGLLGQLLAREAPDLVHVHSLASLGTGVVALAAQLGMPVVMTFHDLWVTCARFFRLPAGGVACPTGTDRTACVTCVNDALQTDPATVAVGLRARDAAISADLAQVAVATAPSATAARWVRDCAPYGRPIEVIPHGLLRTVPAAERAVPPAAGERLRIGTFGGLVAEKGVRELVAAVAGLPVELHLAGPFHDAAFAAGIRDLAARNGTGLVLRGRYGDGDRHPARDLHLAVFPSKCQETYGLVVDEALAHGVPAVVSDAGALAERRGHGGVAVTPLGDLAPVLRGLVTCRDRLDALRAAIPATLPTIAASARHHLELYRRLARA
ncbi:MAG: glycosyltransferase [Planctomycetes bacterium]|nr:glycosyltransferase [Planctomycetota bacterium]